MKFKNVVTMITKKELDSANRMVGHDDFEGFGEAIHSITACCGILSNPSALYKLSDLYNRYASKPDDTAKLDYLKEAVRIFTGESPIVKEFRFRRSRIRLDEDWLRTLSSFNLKAEEMFRLGICIKTYIDYLNAWNDPDRIEVFYKVFTIITGCDSFEQLEKRYFG